VIAKPCPLFTEPGQQRLEIFEGSEVHRGQYRSNSSVKLKAGIGIGIAPAEKDKIFERFYRWRSAGAQHEDPGLGCRWYATLRCAQVRVGGAERHKFIALPSTSRH
jgi:hypothetical protein